ncbi:Basic blue protein [Abeliophyllum distichum]|uniref:Basic blue protein n=1 Tax=Abeliophyllum distichum TaxID=126358 RepID=A0ABD1P9C8_9LAMI
MAERRGSAVVATALMMCLGVLFHCKVAEAATYTVGDAGGWTFDMVDWPKGKNFHAGDILVFNYTPGTHDVVVVDESGYNSCTSPSGAKVYQTGKDQIKLVKGQNYFICDYPGHCQSRMKIAVTAT